MKTPYKKIYFEWADTISPLEKGWKYVGEAIKWGKEVNYWVYEMGWLLEETKEYILIAGRINITKDSEGECIMVGDITKIPKGWIKNRKTIK